MFRLQIGLALAAIAASHWWAGGDPAVGDAVVQEQAPELPSRFPVSAYAPDAYYWQAFSLYRVGDDSGLRSALAALRTQRTKFPQAATQGDAAALERRIQGEL